MRHGAPGRASLLLGLVRRTLQPVPSRLQPHASGPPPHSVCTHSACTQAASHALAQRVVAAQALHLTDVDEGAEPAIFWEVRVRVRLALTRTRTLTLTLT